MAKKSSGASEVNGFISIDNHTNISKSRVKTSLSNSVSKDVDKKNGTEPDHIRRDSKVSSGNKNETKIKGEKKESKSFLANRSGSKKKAGDTLRKTSTSEEIKKTASVNLVKDSSTKVTKTNISKSQVSLNQTASIKKSVNQSARTKSVSTLKTSEKVKDPKSIVSRTDVNPKSDFSSGTKDQNLEESKRKRYYTSEALAYGNKTVSRSTGKNVEARQPYDALKSKTERLKTDSRDESKRRSHAHINLKRKESLKPELKVESEVPENYKDVIYFEVGATDVQKSDVNRENKHDPSQSSGLSRQGTFTKNEKDDQNLPCSSLEHEKEEEEEEYQYEDDFEDYESDFEEDISESGVSSDFESQLLNNVTEQTTHEISESASGKRNRGKILQEEEKKLDSGNYDLTSKIVLPESVKKKQLNDIMEAISKENRMLLDGGMNEGNLTKESEVMSHRLNINDFKMAFEKQKVELENLKKEKVKEERTRRSSLIRKMVTLTEGNLNLFEMKPLSYEMFMELYGKRTVRQVAVEPMIEYNDVEVETLKITHQNKWTQYPPAYHELKGTENDLDIYLEDRRGFGKDKLCTVGNRILKSYDYKKLVKFLSSAGQVILTLLDEEEREKINCNELPLLNNHYDFSDGHLKFNITKIEFLRGRPICDILFSPHSSNIFLTCHKSLENMETLSSYVEQFYGRSIICLWNIMNSSDPDTMLVASCEISALCFDAFHPHIIFAGLNDGSVCLWDLSERSIYHKETVAGNMKYFLRSPTYCTPYAEIMTSSNIVSLKSIGYEKEEQTTVSQNTPTQLITLDFDGVIIIWIVMHTPYKFRRHFPMEELEKEIGLTYWGSVKIVRTTTIPPAHYLPFKEISWGLRFSCMALAPQGERSMLIGTNRGCVIRCLLSGRKATIPCYDEELQGSEIISILCIEPCPQDYSLFLVGCDNGTVRLHGLNRRCPLKIFIVDNEFISVPILKIRWSLLSPGLFFVQSHNLWVQIWNLCKSDQLPQISVSMTKQNATQMDVAKDLRLPFLGFIVNENEVEVHRIKEIFVPNDFVTISEEIECFSSYIKKYIL